MTTSDARGLSHGRENVLNHAGLVGIRRVELRFQLQGRGLDTLSRTCRFLDTDTFRHDQGCPDSVALHCRHELDADAPAEH